MMGAARLGCVGRKGQGEPLAASTRQDPLEALFADGISCKAAVTETSGRGVGVGALRQACRELGGQIEIDTEPLRGRRLFAASRIMPSKIRRSRRWWSVRSASRSGRSRRAALV
jgi:hypothetical protein